MTKLNLAAITLLAGLSPNWVWAVSGYLTDSSDIIVRDSYEECWHTGFWTPAMAVEGCDAVAKPAEAAPPKPEPEPVQAAPQPEPKAPTITPIVLTAGTHFDFDKAILKPAGEQALQGLIAEIKALPKQPALRITGHADRIGSAAYNQALSLRRAHVVGDYLREHGDIPAHKLQLVGKGESEPLVGCDGIRGSALIQCLEPNRRVEVRTLGAKKVEDD